MAELTAQEKREALRQAYVVSKRARPTVKHLMKIPHTRWSPAHRQGVGVFVVLYKAIEATEQRVAVLES